MGNILGFHELIVHPNTPAKMVERVRVQITRTARDDFSLEYETSPAEALALPAPTDARRADDLWQTTCFELFARPKGSESYLEFNFSPSCQWAAYTFSGYRSGRRDLPTQGPEIWISRADDWFWLLVEWMPPLGPEPLQLGLSAIIEETDGTKSYWALAHPPGDKPDFHHPDSFALELPLSIRHPGLDRGSTFSTNGS